jgi:hypothetical protein
MTIARSQLIDPTLTRWYHCVSRCVRRAFLLGEGSDDRKGWVEKRLEELAEIFAIAVGGFSVMDNHLHVLVRLDQDIARSWSDEEVVRRWGRLFPPRDRSGAALPVPEAWVQWRLENAHWVATIRGRLQSISWFMKCLKEPLSRLVNRQEQVRGAFFEGRFKSVAIWSITPDGSFAQERSRSRRSWRESSIGWGAAPRAGGLAWRSCARVACSVDSSQPVERSCGRRPRD